MDTIYEQIGGRPALEAVVADFYHRVLADPKLAPFFVNTDMPALEAKQVAFFAGALGGPEPYRGVGLRRAHQGLGIEQEHFDLVVEYLGAALVSAGVPADVVAEIAGAVAPLADDIVSKPTESATA